MADGTTGQGDDPLPAEQAAATPTPDLVARNPAERAALLAIRAAGLRAGRPRTLVLLWNGVRLTALGTVHIG